MVVKSSPYLLHEYTEQIRDRAFVLKYEAQNLRSLLTHQSEWFTPVPAFDMIARMLARLEAIANALLTKIWTMRRNIAQESPHAGEASSDPLADLVPILDWCEAKLAALVECLHQRSSSWAMPDWSAQQPGTDGLIEFRKFYAAVDAMMLALYLDIYGREWVVHAEANQQPWLPITIFGGPYSIRYRSPFDSRKRLASIHLGLAMVPRAELFRARLWGSLAHEVAHLKALDLFRPMHGLLYLPIEVSRDTDKCRSWLNSRRIEDIGRMSLKCSHPDLKETAELWLEMVAYVENVHARIQARARLVGDVPTQCYSQAVELLCDSVSVHITGPASLLGFASLGNPYEGMKANGDVGSRRNRVCEGMINSSHPPRLTRIAIMARTLQERGFGEFLRSWGVDEYVERASNCADEDVSPCLEIWSEQIPRISPMVSEVARRIVANSEPFRFDHLQPVINNASLGPNSLYSGFVPKHWLMVPWIKRQMVYQHLCDLSGTTAKARGELLGYANPHLPPALFGPLVIRLCRYGEREWSGIRDEANSKRKGG